jgi:aromatic-amino-acid transaminase
MSFFTTEARISKDPIVGLIQKSSEDKSENKLLAIIGAATDDNGKLIVPEIISETAKEILSDGLGMDYVPSPGLPELAPLMSSEILGKELEAKLKAAGVKRSEVSTLGGTNAISLAIQACTALEDEIITHDPHWAGYDSITLALPRKPLINFEFLDSNQNLNFDSFQRTCESVYQNPKNSKLTIILNTPFDNPLGKDLGLDVWKRLAEILSSFAEKDILIILDTAYIDFGPSGKDYNRLNYLLTLFEKIPNLSLVIAGTVSKSFAMYGARVGVATLLSKDEEKISNWKNIVGGVVRGVFSNAPRFTQELALRILKDPDKLSKIHDFQKATSRLLLKRSEFFAENIKNYPEIFEPIKPDGGFFYSLKIRDKGFASRLSQVLLEQHVYVPILSEKYLRIPICGLSEVKLEKLSRRILELVSNLLINK